MLDTPNRLKRALVALSAFALLAGCSDALRGVEDDGRGPMSGGSTGTGLGSGTTERETTRSGAFDPDARLELREVTKGVSEL
jgi:hypothetical protein